MKENNFQNKPSELETSTSLLRDLKNNPDSLRWQEFVRIYTPYFKYILRNINAKNNFIINEDYFDDIVQEVFIVLVKNFPTFEYDKTKGHFKSYLYKTVFNRAMKFNEQATEKYRKHVDNDAVEKQLDAVDYYKAASFEKENQEVVEALFKLIMERVFSSGKFSEETKTIFLKLVSEQATVEELAEQYGKTTNNIYQIKKRILDAIYQRQEIIMAKNNNLLDLLETMLKEDSKNEDQ
ncbi:MAG: sigma-70 family RNA polymerase sigma factor [Kiritimatiellae bacterium]|nr:sigma-70 family RNA polymerase sigma factor [Kiritimatiellia bacterium]